MYCTTPIHCTSPHSNRPPCTRTHCTALHQTALCCTPLGCIVLHHTALNSTIYFSAPYCIVLHPTMLYCSTQYCTPCCGDSRGKLCTTLVRLWSAHYRGYSPTFGHFTSDILPTIGHTIKIFCQLLETLD